MSNAPFDPDDNFRELDIDPTPPEAPWSHARELIDEAAAHKVFGPHRRKPHNPADDRDEYDDERAARQETVFKLIEFLVGDSMNPEAIGRRCLILCSAFGLGKAGQYNSNELAKMFGVTPPRLSQIRSAYIEAELPNFKTRVLRGKTAQLRAKAKLQS